MEVKTISPTLPVTIQGDALRKRDEQIRRVLNAAQYKKYKETEKHLRAAITKEELAGNGTDRQSSNEQDL